MKTFIFGPDNCRVYISFGKSLRTRDQHLEQVHIARQTFLFEVGKEESKCNVTYFFTAPFLQVMVGRHLPDFTPSWAALPDNVVQFPKRKVS